MTLRQQKGTLFSCLVMLLLLAGAVLTARGINQLATATNLADEWRWGPRYLNLFLISAAAVFVVGAWRGPIVAGIFLGLTGALAGGVVVPVLVVAVLTLSAYVLGRKLCPAPNVAVTDCLLVGMVIFGTLFGLMVHFPINNAGTWGVLIALPLLIGGRHVRELLPALALRVREGMHLYLLQCAIVAAVLLHFIVTLMPEVGHDALVTHLFVPAHVSYHQTWGFDIGSYIWAVMPMFVDWLYTAGFLFAGETGARLVNFGGIVLLAELVYRCACWMGARSVPASWAVLIFLVTPLTFTESTSLFIETIWSALVVGGTLALLRLMTSPKYAIRDIPLGGIFLGGALAAKAVTLTVLPILGLMVVATYRRWFSRAVLGPMCIGVAAFMLIGMVPYVTALNLTGNPVFPFFNAQFHSPFFPAENFKPPEIFERGIAWNTLYRMTFDSGKYLEATPGAAGFQWLLLVVPAVITLALTRDRRALLVAGIAAGALWLTFGQTAYLRYVFPSFALACSVIAAALASMQACSNLWAWRASILVAVTVVTLNLLHFSAGTNYGEIDFDVISLERARDAYIEKTVPVRAAVKVVNALNLEHTPVAFFSVPLTAGLKAKALYSNWYNVDFANKTLKTHDVKEIGRMLFQHDVEYVVVDDTWEHPELRRLVTLASNEVGRIGTVSVRRVSDAYRFSQELLSAPAFEPAGTWHFTEGAKLVPGTGALVSVESPAYSAVGINPGLLYRFSVDAKCYDGPADGRLQVNWLRPDGSLVRADIQVFGCTTETAAHSMDIRAPAEALQAIVYATGHTQRTLIFSRISFKN